MSAAASLVLALLFALPLTLVGPAAPAAAAPGRCEPGMGVTVVVDFGGLGGGVPIGCDPGGDGSKAANAVVTAAGFTITYAAGQPFVCRIDGKPSSGQESCQRTPPADAYWGLFWSDGKSGSWTYSSKGIASLKVPDGGSIGLRWQDGGERDLPGAAPTVSAAPTPKPRPTPRPSATETPAPPPSAAPSRSSVPAPSVTPSSSPPGDATTTAQIDKGAATKGDKVASGKQKPPKTEGSRKSATTPASSPAPPTGDAAPVAADLETTAGEAADSDAGPVWLAAGAVVALGAAVAVTAVRRRRS